MRNAMLKCASCVGQPGFVVLSAVQPKWPNEVNIINTKPANGIAVRTVTNNLMT